MPRPMEANGSVTPRRYGCAMREIRFAIVLVALILLGLVPETRSIFIDVITAIGAAVGQGLGKLLTHVAS